MKWQVELSVRKIMRALLLAGWRLLLLPVAAFAGVLIFAELIVILSQPQTTGDVLGASLSALVSFTLFVVIVTLLSVWLTAYLSYRRVVRQGGNGLQTYMIGDGSLTYAAAGDEVKLALANIAVVRQHAGVVVLKRAGAQRFYLLFDSSEDQAQAVELLGAPSAQKIVQ